jgi:hypothetical protein
MKTSEVDKTQKTFNDFAMLNRIVLHPHQDVKRKRFAPYLNTQTLEAQVHL